MNTEHQHNHRPSGSADEKAAHDTMMKCEDIQSVLFDYMARELGSARSDLVREHLRKCPSCRESAADIQSTLDLMKRAGDEQLEVVTSLSDDRRKRMRRALLHPVLHWIDQHHILVSIIVAGLALLTLAVLLREVRTRRDRLEIGQTLIYKGAGSGWVKTDAEPDGEDQDDTRHEQ